MTKLKLEYQMQEGGPRPCLAVRSKNPDDGDWVATVRSQEDAEEIAKRYNRYPLLVAFIQQLGKFSEDDETVDFVVNNIEDVLEDEEGYEIEEDIPYFNNSDIFDLY